MEKDDDDDAMRCRAQSCCRRCSGWAAEEGCIWRFIKVAVQRGEIETVSKFNNSHIYVVTLMVIRRVARLQVFGILFFFFRVLPLGGNKFGLVLSGILDLFVDR